MVSEKLTGSNKFSGMPKTRIKSSNLGCLTHQKMQKMKFGHVYIYIDVRKSLFKADGFESFSRFLFVLAFVKR